jgi:uncharacterized protein YeaO (DUF488 family)
MKRLLFILLMFSPLWALAQTNSKADDIMNTADFIWGQGYGATMKEADKEALANLMSKISVQVESDFVIDEREVNTAAGNDAHSTVQNVVRTYSQGTLKNTRTVIVSEAPTAAVIRYIKKSELEKIFKEREENVLTYVYSARNAEKNGRIDAALRYYYWASCLLKSLQNPSQVKFTEDGVKFPLTMWIPEQIRTILSLIKVEVTKIDGQNVSLLFTYKDKPVTSLDFHYWDGQNYSNIFSAKDGIMEVEMRPGAPTNKFNIQYEYEFKSQMRQDPELEQLMNIFNTVNYKEATVTVLSGNKSEQKQAQAVLQEAVMNMSMATHAVQVAQPKTFAKTVDQVVNAIKQKNYASVADQFTTEGFNMFDKLVHYGNATVIGNPNLQFYQLGDRTICRSVPMKFTFKNNKRAFVEDVTFTFNKDQKIESVAFGLDKTARDDIFNRDAAAWNDSVRMVIATFLENYKTAFALKRLDYIQSIFDDDAIIIVGHVTKHANKKGENQRYIDNEMVKYTRLDKAAYLKNLEKSFGSNEFINIRFTDNEVKKMGKGGETYGIQIHQDYYSSSYGDTGYLFLMVDLNEMDAPVIKVRTWQPNRDPNINGNFERDDPYYGLIYGGNFD